MEQAPRRFNQVAAKILVVEEDEILRRSLRGRLEAEGFRVVTVSDGEEALRAMGLEMPDAIILDLDVPEVDGMSVWRRLRTDQDAARVPILILGGDGDNLDQVVSPDLNADDFMTKPYNNQEMIARLKTMLRRTALAPPSRMLLAGAIEMDLDRYVVKVGGVEVRFTSKEFELLRTLIEAKGRALRREFLLDKVWGYGGSADVESRTVDVHIRRLREKLGPDGGCILTIRNVGYRFDMMRTLLQKASTRADLT